MINDFETAINFLLLQYLDSKYPVGNLSIDYGMIFNIFMKSYAAFS